MPQFGSLILQRRVTAENNALSQEINNINLNQQFKGLIAKGLARNSDELSENIEVLE
jgi:hypothetical protein